MGEKAGRQNDERDRDWTCISCSALLGKIGMKPGTPQYGVLRIKHKELFVYTKGGEVKVVCPRCGAENAISDQDYVDYITKGQVQQRIQCPNCSKNLEAVTCPDCGAGIDLPKDSTNRRGINKSEGGTKEKGGQ